ncbi:MAG: hypothetical protein ABIS59_00945 [Candidatus Saccharibacteria bacterium]
MILILHILIALSSVAHTTYLYMRPSQSKLKVTYTMVGLTLASGTYLTILNPSHLASSCTSGLIYIGVIMVGVVAAQRKLAESYITKD